MRIYLCVSVRLGVFVFVYMPVFMCVLDSVGFRICKYAYLACMCVMIFFKKFKILT